MVATVRLAGCRTTAAVAVGPARSGGPACRHETHAKAPPNERPSYKPAPAALTATGGRPHQSGDSSTHLEIGMGKYFIGWLLGVPTILLILFYFFFG